MDRETSDRYFDPRTRILDYPIRIGNRKNAQASVARKLRVKHWRARPLPESPIEFESLRHTWDRNPYEPDR